ncbi:MAG: lipoprotein ABC transporter ATP-binding protein [Omnitrophica WOR_2 bacterium RIFCSPLOWO2_12_FULL_50_9]|nr:MAG: lipoprotein ABC transporter ATP-binding protein [Omnitrophica WOR_2 bacterium RIFCSPHIGHO2_02_FULL_50_17]OGX42023.1 MAG: lipoprotein ABC transporter ATP-binding protein [Omnitrophica WOR_2 bacterium RIFCSPLOWO2_12_FULL_50_9]
MVLLEAANISKSYHNTHNPLHVLKGVNIQVDVGEIVSIVGPSGVGKSTLLHILGGLDTPDEGTVSLQGEDIYGLSDGDRARVRNGKIGFIFQFYHLLPEFTALENVLLPAFVRRDEKDMKQLESKGRSVLKQVGLQKRVEHKPHELSGGEQQRVAIARALINQPKIIFCDEPTGNLDSETGKEIIALLKELNARNKQAFVIVTHDESIAQMSHRTVFMRDGRLV